MGSASDLFDLAADVLAASAAILATTSGGTPERAFVTHALPALDCCDQLTVNVAGIGEAPTQVTSPLDSGLRHKTSRVNLTALQITITRCVPVPDSNGRPPSPAAQQAAEEEMSQDAWALWNGLFRMVEAEQLLGSCDLVFFDGLIPLQEQGGCAGWTFQIRFELSGYDPLSGS